MRGANADSTQLRVAFYISDASPRFRSILFTRFDYLGNGAHLAGETHQD